MLDTWNLECAARIDCSPRGLVVSGSLAEATGCATWHQHCHCASRVVAVVAVAVAVAAADEDATAAYQQQPITAHCGPATACDTTLWQPRCLDNICTCCAKLQAHDVPAMPQHQLPLCLLSFPLQSSAHVARCEASSAQAAVPNENKMEILR